MTTKVNHLIQVPKKPRIIIELLPDGNSLMRVEGGINQIAVALMLSAQLNTLLPNMFKAVFSAASGVVKPDGTPVIPNTIEIKTEEQPETETEVKSS